MTPDAVHWNCSATKHGRPSSKFQDLHVWGCPVIVLVWWGLTYSQPYHSRDFRLIQGFSHAGTRFRQCCGQPYVMLKVSTVLGLYRPLSTEFQTPNSERQLFPSLFVRHQLLRAKDPHRKILAPFHCHHTPYCLVGPSSTKDFDKDSLFVASVFLSIDCEIVQYHTHDDDDQDLRVFVRFYG